MKAVQAERRKLNVTESRNTVSLCGAIKCYPEGFRCKFERLRGSFAVWS